MSSYLFVVAHPDDEVLGAGAMIYDLGKAGHDVHVLVLNTVDTTRYIGYSEKLRQDLEQSDMMLNVKTITAKGYEDSEFHRASHRIMVQDIESEIRKYFPDYIFTHHPGDLFIIKSEKYPMGITIWIDIVNTVISFVFCHFITAFVFLVARNLYQR